MRMELAGKRKAGLTLLEVLVVVLVLFILAFILLSKLPRHQDAEHRQRVICLNNLKQIGIAYRVWAGDHGDKFPMAVLTNAAGGLLYTNGDSMFEFYKVMSNELSNPKILICPADRERRAATNFADYTGNSKTSYFVALQATNGDIWGRFLSGDYNITNGNALRYGALELTTNRIGGWTEELHKERGNIGMADGSVQQFSSLALNAAVARTGLATNRLLMPVY